MLYALLIILVILLVSIGIGGPVSTTIGFTACAAMIIFVGFGNLTYLGSITYSNAISANNAIVPLFIMMAEFMTHGDIAGDIYYVFAKITHKIRGGLAVATVLTCTVFAALCGSSPATAATISRVSLKEMTSRGYKPDFAIGTVAGGGTLGIMIPPSVTLVMFGILTQTSIVDLLMAGVLPGIMLAVIMCLYNLIRANVNPTVVGEPSRKRRGHRTQEEYTPKLEETYNTTIWQDIKAAAPALLLIVFIMVAMYTGAATATECAGIGAIVAFLLVVFRHKMTWENFKKSMFATVRTSSMMILMMTSSLMLSNVISRLGIATTLAQACTAYGVNRWVVMGLLFVLWYFLGTIMSATAMVTLTIPFVFPSLVALGFEPLWIGIVSTLCVEVGMITPPVGNNLFILKLTTGLDMGTIIKGTIPYVLLLTLGLIILCFFPQIATIIPAMMVK